MHPDSNAVYARLEQVMQTTNEATLKEAADYFNDVRGASWMPDTLEEFVATSVKLARWGEPEDEQTIEALQALAAHPLPPALINFYKTRGSFSGGAHLREMLIYAPRRLVALHADDRKGYHLQSLGLADMIRHCWGNDRPELDHGSEHYQDEDIDYLNRHYALIGEIHTDEQYESYHFLYCDQAGRFGIFYFHQDDMDMRPLLGRSPATMSWEELLHAALDIASGHMNEDGGVAR